VNLNNFLAAMTKILPVVGETVIALHPNNPNEALKIRVGAELVKAIADSLHQSSTPPADAGNDTQAT
jgi:hypothetical protein